MLRPLNRPSTTHRTLFGLSQPDGRERGAGEASAPHCERIDVGLEWLTPRT